MQIITVDNGEFEALVAAISSGENIGTYWKEGKKTVVHATPKFVIIQPENHPEKLAYKPARGIIDAQQMAVRFLIREQQRGNKVEIKSEYEQSV